MRNKMKENWLINRIGLIDFWYYDDQEFTFINGRMLLRGSNGSGKSVTMQSVVPLLLDGNMRPERLDPFGSRDRKMSSYLLEEGDGREERTGYLYMEFTKPELGIYHTIGMGIRARRGKPLESWYFCISDGRRVNRDFFLYKENDGKITLTQRELEARIGTGGRVMSSQQDYMEYVNKQFFGFETVEEYKEMIDLLIQLRTPKLSKDFKPSVINEILSDSLQPLSEDDLRPMSEAIENMDTLSTNLANKISSAQAAEKINKQYERYSRCVLREKTELYASAVEEQRKLQKDMERKSGELLSHAEQVTVEQEKRVKLEQEQKVLEQQKETLNSSDAVALKQREAAVAGDQKEAEQSRRDKERQLEVKQEKWREQEKRCQKASQEEELLSKEMTDKLQEMGDGLETVFSDEHSFFQQEFREHMTENISFEAHRHQLQKLTGKLEEGITILKEMENQKAQREELLARYDQEKKVRSNMERFIMEEETALAELIGNQKEQIYDWNHQNQELKLPQETLAEINRFLDQFDARSDYHEVRKAVSDCYFASHSELQKKKTEAETRETRQKQDRDDIRIRLQEWKEIQDPEPEVSDAVRRNRERLQQRKIPYHRFYETLDFDVSMKPEQANLMEEALLEMGLLDALVVENSYKAEILHMDSGMCDKYIFTDNLYQGKNLTELFSVSEEMNDLFGSQQILSVLGSIGREENTGTYIDEDGTYGLGVLRGTVTGEYQARFIGKGARIRYREEQIALLEKQLAEAGKRLEELHTDTENLAKRLEKLQKEYELLPSGESLHEKAGQIEDRRRLLAGQVQKIQELEEQLAKKTERIRLLLEKAQTEAEMVYLECRLDVFSRALEEVREYYQQLLELRAEHAKYLMTITTRENAREQMEDIDADLENIRYELSVIQRRLQKAELELSSIQEQLKLTNYDEIQEQLNHCLNRLAQLPEEVAACIRSESDHEHEWKKCQEFMEQAKPKIEFATGRAALLRENLKKELSLGCTEYKALENDEGENWESRILQMKTALQAGTAKDENRENLGTRLNQVFYENRGYLLDFSPSLQNIFEEDYKEQYGDIYPRRMEARARYRGENLVLGKLLDYLKEEIEDIQNLIKNGDKELFEDILANTIGRKIRSKINASMVWVDKMNQLMESMNTSSGLKLSLKWRSKTAELEEQLDTKELVDLLKKDAKLMTETEFDKLSVHFRSKVEQARRNTRDNAGQLSFYAIMRDTLDYRKWFEFQLYFQKSGETKKELTNSWFGTFSGGEKAMSMYVPLFSAVVAKYQGGREDAPRLVSLDEAFAGVDNRNIRDMFRLMSEFQFNFIINSQVLWGDCDTLDGLAIYQLHRLNNQKFVTVMSFVWNGAERKSVVEIRN